MKVAKIRGYGARKRLKEMLEQGYSPGRISKEIPEIKYGMYVKEVKLGMSEENYNKRLYGTYSPERAIYSLIKKDFTDEEIEVAYKYMKELEKQGKREDGK